MKVIYHLGVHGTDEDRIVATLLQNSDALCADGIAVPTPERYRDAVARTMLRLRNEAITPQIQADMLDRLGIAGEAVGRVVLSHEAFLGLPGQAVGDNQFYPMLEGKIGRLRTMFGAHEAEFCVGICNPALFIPAVFDRSQEDDLHSFLGGSDPMRLRWSAMLSRLRDTVPDCKITVWANEDTPFTWPEVIQAISGHRAGTSIEGLDDLFDTIMSPGGLRRMSSYLQAHPPADREAYKTIIERFLDKFGQEDMVETEIDLPGWDGSYVETLTALYDRDLAVIPEMPGISYIAT